MMTTTTSKTKVSTAVKEAIGDERQHCRFTNTKNPYYLNIAEASDLHLGHNRTPTEWITENLLSAFPDNPETAALDLIILAGDIFDELIYLPKHGIVTEVEMWIMRLLLICVKYNIEIMIVEGTPRHDRKQSYLFEHINKLYNIGATVIYQKKLTVYKHERWNATFLFVPDEWHPDPEEVFNASVRALRESGLTKVDYAIMHSAFEYHYPAELSLPTLNSASFLSIVTEWIFIGHIHLNRVYERIINAGSFDRLTFGEESPKGHYRVQSHGLNTVGDVVEFRENTNAKRYDTIDVTGLGAKEVEQAVYAKNMPRHSNLRLLCEKGDVATVIEKNLQSTFEHFRIVVSTKKVKKVVATQTDPLKPTRPLVCVDIAPDNVERLMATRLSKNTNTSPEDIERILKRLGGLVNG